MDQVNTHFLPKSCKKLKKKNINTGTGLAPFRGFIQERNLSREEGKTVGATILYFGCRKKSEDYIYEEVKIYSFLSKINDFNRKLKKKLQELEEYARNGTLTLKLAFSRDQEKKVYVTHLLEQDSDLVWNVIGENKGHIYICG